MHKNRKARIIQGCNADTRPAAPRRAPATDVSGGNRAERGARTHQVLANVLRTIQQRQLDASRMFTDLLRAESPITALARTSRASPITR